MAVNTTINLLQAVNRSITGVKKAPVLEKYPTQLNTADLPFVISWPAEGTWHHEGMGGALKRQDRVYRILVYIEPLGQNDIPTRAAAAAVLLQRFIEKYLDPATVALADPSGSNPYQVTVEEGANSPHSDGGLVSNLVFGGVPYHGFEVRVRVRELW